MAGEGSVLSSRLQEVARRALDDSLGGCSVDEFCDGFSVDPSHRPVLAYVFTEAQAKLRENSLVRAHARAAGAAGDSPRLLGLHCFTDRAPHVRSETMPHTTGAADSCGRPGVAQAEFDLIFNELGVTASL